ncbi:MAG TPA: hypothetical protein VFL47_13865, partial [Flavisolibacter sp.]|nr:hypothetical protein [Flavisolibacter sp.]
AHAAVTPLIAVVYFYPTYSHDLLMLGFPWAITAPLFMLMLALWLKKNSAENAGNRPAKIRQEKLNVYHNQPPTSRL